MSEEPTNYCRNAPAGFKCDGRSALSELGGCAGAGRVRLLGEFRSSVETPNQQLAVVR